VIRTASHRGRRGDRASAAAASWGKACIWIPRRRDSSRLRRNTRQPTLPVHPFSPRAGRRACVGLWVRGGGERCGPRYAYSVAGLWSKTTTRLQGAGHMAEGYSRARYTAATAAPALGSSLPQLRRDSARIVCYLRPSLRLPPSLPHTYAPASRSRTLELVGSEHEALLAV
jgi:hypothetical protein